MPWQLSDSGRGIRFGMEAGWVGGYTPFQATEGRYVVTDPSFYPQISVIDLDDFTEISVSDPREFVLSHLEVDLKTDKEIRQYTVSVGGQEHLFEFSESDSNDWFEQPTVQNILRFGIKDNQLIAELPIQISSGNYLGDAIIRYAFVNGKIEHSKIEITKEGSSL